MVWEAVIQKVNDLPGEGGSGCNPLEFLRSVSAAVGVRVQKGRAPAACPGCRCSCCSHHPAAPTAAPAWPQGRRTGPRGRAGPSVDGRDRAVSAPVPAPGPGPAEQLPHTSPGASLWLKTAETARWCCSSAWQLWVPPPSLLGAGPCVLPSAQGSKHCSGRALHQGSAALDLIHR